MFKPTKNLAQVWHNVDERKTFEDAALKQAKGNFIAELKEEEFRSVEQFKDFLRDFDEGDLRHDVFEMTEEAEDERVLAGHPDITPEQSFRRLVDSLEIEESIRIHKEVIAEKQ